MVALYFQQLSNICTFFHLKEIEYIGLLKIVLNGRLIISSLLLFLEYKK